MRKDIAIAVVAVAVIIAVTFGLAKMRPGFPASSSSTTTTETSGAASLGSDKVVLRVNGEPVTEGEFNAFLAAVPEQQRGVFATPAGRRELANELVRMKALEQEANKLGLEKDPEVATQLKLLKSQVIASRALQKIVQEKSEKQIQAAYEKEKKGSLSLRHIVVAYAGGMLPPRGGAKAPTPEQAMQKAAGIVARVRGGVDFTLLARTESDDPETAQRGGSLGPMRPEQLPPDVSGVVSKLKPGQVSDPVKTQFGVHVFTVTEPTLDEMRPMLEQQVQQEIAQQELGRLQKSAKVDMDPQFFPPVPEQQQQRAPQAQPQPSAPAPARKQ